MDNANGSASTITPMPNGERGERGDRGDRVDPPLARRTVASTMDAALAPGMAHGQAATVTPLTPGEAHRPAKYSPYHVHGSVLEGGDSPSVLAQPAAANAQGQGSQYHPSPPIPRRAREVLAGAQDVIATQYRQAKEGTGDYVRENPWRSIALAAVGGLIVGLLAAR